MPSDFPRSPKFLKGALVAYQFQLLGVLHNIIVCKAIYYLSVFESYNL